MKRARLYIVAHWALRDLLLDRRMALVSLLLVCGLALAPLFIHVARSTVIDGWIAMLASDPRNRQVIVVGEAGLDEVRLARIASWPETGFLVPEPSTFIASAALEANGRLAQFDMLTSRAGDPILGNSSPPDDNTVTLTAAAADGLGVIKGETVRLVLRRDPEDRSPEFLYVPLEVVGIVPERVWPGEIVFLSPARGAGAVDWIAFDSSRARPAPLRLPPDRHTPEPEHEVQAIDPALSHGARTWRSLRIYASELQEAPVLRDRLRSEGLNVRLDTDQVARLTSLSGAMNTLASAVFGTSLVVFSLALLLLQWMSILRKRKEVALMSAAGLSMVELTLFFAIQAACVTAAGLAIATLAIPPAQTMASDMAQAIVGAVQQPPLGWWALALAAASTLLFAVGISIAAARSLKRLDIARLLRGD